MAGCGEAMRGRLEDATYHSAGRVLSRIGYVV